MSWDIFVQELPPGITTVDEIPADFRPGPLGSRSDIVAGIMRVVPTADFTTPEWGRIEGTGFSIEVNLAPGDPVTSFAFHVRGDDNAAHLVADILDELDLQALDPQAPGGVFTRQTATLSLERWRHYRNEVLGT